MPEWTEHLRPRLALLKLSAEREAEILEEMSQHLDQRYEELRARGATDAEARRLSVDELSDAEAFAEQMSSLRESSAPEPITPGAPAAYLFSDLRQDLRYATRSLWKRLGFSAAVVLTLALGIGATSAVFSVVHGVVLKPLPFDEPDRLVALYHRAPPLNPGEGAAAFTEMNQGPATYFTYRDNQRAFIDVGAWDRREASITGRGEPERVEVLAVTYATLPLLRVQPLLGRFFSSEDDLPGQPVRVVLSHGYWQRKFGGVADIIGRTVAVDGTAAEIIGVLPPSFRFPRSDPALLLPLQPDRADANGVSFDFQAFGRLRPGVTLDEARADMARLIPLVEEVPGYADYHLEPDLYPLVQHAIGDVGRILWILLATAGIVLLIACANVANLVLVRAEGRQQELAVRAALGASRGRIARQLVLENLVLGIAGGAIGLLFARACIGMLTRMAPATLPRVDEIALDPVVVLFTLAISLLTGLLLGLIPILKVGRPVALVLREGGRTASDAASRQHTRNTLVVAQVSMAFVLLIVSGLMVRTFLALVQVDPGFVRPEQVQTFRIEIPAGPGDDPLAMARAHQRVADGLRQVPGVTSVGLSSSITMDGEDNSNPIDVQGGPGCDEATASCWSFLRLKTVAPGYFETMGNPIVAGRAITWSDIYEMRHLVMISETMARKHWSSPVEALGGRLKPFNPDQPWYEVVGVVGDEHDDGLDRPATGFVYWPLVNDSYGQSTISYSVRSDRAGDAGFLGELREAVWSVNPDVPLSDVMTLARIQAASMANTSFALVMLAMAAGVALLLGVVGIYGVIAYVAAQRTREVGIRMALGAQIGDVRRMFLRYGLWLTAIGIALGIGAALLVTRAISTLLFGVATTDPMTYLVVSVAMAVVALVASDLPARRAARVDPTVALRVEM